MNKRETIHIRGFAIVRDSIVSVMPPKHLVKESKWRVEVATTGPDHIVFDTKTVPIKGATDCHLGFASGGIGMTRILAKKLSAEEVAQGIYEFIVEVLNKGESNGDIRKYCTVGNQHWTERPVLKDGGNLARGKAKREPGS